MKAAFDELRSRWREGWTTNPDIVGVHGPFHAMCKLPDKIEERLKQLKTEGRLSDRGMREELRTFTRAELLTALQHASKGSERMRNAADTARANLGLRLSKPDPVDVAGAMLRSEIRAHLKSLPRGQAATLLAGDGAEALLEAAFEGPAVLSGLDDAARGQIERHQVERRFGKELGNIDEMRGAADLLATAREVAASHLATELGFASTPEFEKWAAASTGETP